MSTAYGVATEAKIAMRDYVGSEQCYYLLRAISEQAVGHGMIAEEVTQDWGTVLAATLTRAVPHYVSPEVCEALIAAAPAIPDYNLFKADIAHPVGWAYFARPLPVDNAVEFEDVKAAGLKVRETDWLGPVVAFSWCPLNIGGDRTYGSTKGRVETDLEKANALSIHVYRSASERPSGIPIASIVWKFGQGMMALYDDGYLDLGADGLPNMSRTTLQELRYFGALVAFMGQELFPTQRERLPRDSRKRLERAGYYPGSDVNEPRVIYLRRVTQRPEGDPGDRHIEYTQRFWVTGHWRNQWYPSEDRHKPKWIPSYIKGPDGLPIAARRDELVAVVR